MRLFVRDNRAICPRCAGLITAKQNYYFCTGMDGKETDVELNEGKTS